MNQVPDRKRLIRIVAGVGFVFATGMLLFPRWHWTVYDVIDGESQVSFVTRPPTPYAHVDLQEIVYLELGILTLTVGAIFFLRQRDKDEQVKAHWRSKWDYATNNPETLLRASEKTIVQSEVLLRAAQGGQETPKEELLRVSQGE